MAYLKGSLLSIGMHWLALGWSLAQQHHSIFTKQSIIQWENNLYKRALTEFNLVEYFWIFRVICKLDKIGPQSSSHSRISKPEEENLAMLVPPWWSASILTLQSPVLFWRSLFDSATILVS